MITVAEEAIAVPDLKNNRMQLTLRNYSTHEMGKDQMSRDTVAPSGQQGLDASPPSQTPLRSVGMSTRQLLAYPRNKPDWIEYQIELHRRFALPVACLMLAMVGIPLGIATRKGGRAAGYVNAIFVAFFCYYLAFVSLLGMARQKIAPCAGGAMAAQRRLLRGGTDLPGPPGKARRLRFLRRSARARSGLLQGR